MLRLTKKSVAISTVAVVAGLCLLGTPLPTSATDLVSPTPPQPTTTLVSPPQPTTTLVSPTPPQSTTTLVSPDAVPAVTMANFTRLAPGLPYAEVVRILGVEGTLVSESTLGDLTSVMYSWPGTGGALGANMSVLFHNDALISKAQYGLV